MNQDNSDIKSKIDKIDDINAEKVINDDDIKLNNELSNMNMNIDKNRVCLCCLKVVEGSSRCSQCRTALYCNRACQEKHWPVHQNICINSNIAEDSYEKLSMIAKNHFKQGNYPKAEKVLIKLLSRCREKLGESHPHTLITMGNLASNFNIQARNIEAEVLFKQCLAKKKVTLGENDPTTLDTMNCLANCFSDQGKFIEAKVLFKQCLAKQKAVLGENHADTLGTMIDLASCHDRQGEFMEAEVLMKLVVLEKGHTSDDLASTYSKAEVLYKQCFDEMKRVLGESHPNTLDTMHNLANSYACQGKISEGELLFKQCFAKQKVTLGENHPDTLKTKNKLATIYRMHLLT